MGRLNGYPFLVLGVIGVFLLFNSVSLTRARNELSTNGVRRFHFLVDHLCPIGFPETMLGHFNKKRSANQMRQLRIGEEALLRVLDWAAYRLCLRDNSRPLCRVYERFFANYGLIKVTLDLSPEDKSIHIERIFAHLNLNNVRPKDLSMKRHLFDRFTEKEWADSSEMAVFCMQNFGSVDIYFLFNRAKKMNDVDDDNDDKRKPITASPFIRPPRPYIRPPQPEPLPPFDYPIAPTPVDMYKTYVFPQSRNNCPSGFSHAIVGAFNEQRRKEGISGPLSLDSTLSQAASEIIEQTRCEDCPLLKANYPTYGQNSFRRNQASRKTEFRLNIGKVMKQIRKQPVLTSGNGKVKYTDGQWAQVKRMGVACSTYLMTSPEVSSILRVHFTFERPN